MSSLWLHNGTVFTGVATLKDTTVKITDRRIEDVMNNNRFAQKRIPAGDTVYDVGGAWISPGFIDTHIHGLHGFDTTDGSVESIHAMSEAVTEYGVTSFLPTMYPQEEGRFEVCMKAVVESMDDAPGARIGGMHLEGPFISRDKHGVLEPRYMKDVDIDLMRHYWHTAGGHITVMTVAPELKGMHELALYCARKGIVLSAGHSNATYENMLEGIEAGILHSTHFFNAMRRLHHRDPGVVGAIMIHPDVSCEIIADGYHLHEAIVKLLLRVKPVDRIVLVTDALRPTHQSSGALRANDEPVRFEGGVFVRESDGTIAGSGLTMLKGVRNLVDFGVLRDDAFRMASCNPATVINRQHETGYLLPGRRADVAVVDDDFNLKMTMVDGMVKKNYL